MQDKLHTYQCQLAQPDKCRRMQQKHSDTCWITSNTDDKQWYIIKLGNPEHQCQHCSQEVAANVTVVSVAALQAQPMACAQSRLTIPRICITGL